jgi:hypothetical protein
MKANSGYFFRREPCPCCESGPLLMIACAQCGAVMGWCGELQYGVGRWVDGALFPFERGEHIDWARKHCPACGAAAERLGYAEAAALQGAGLRSQDLMWAGVDGAISSIDPAW